MGKNVTDETTFDHPSYGLVSFHHRTGGAMRLFGSCVEDHHHTVALTIKRATLARSNTGDRFSPGADLIEVVMSSAQFAELLTTMNVYAGTPCTITRFGGRVEEPPVIPSEASTIRAEFRARMAGIATSLAEKQAGVMALLPKSLQKGVRRQIEIAVESMVTEVASNAPFFVEVFQEATEKVVTAAKAEINAIVTHVAHVTGLEVLKKHFSGEAMVPVIEAMEPLPLLPPKPPEPDDA